MSDCHKRIGKLLIIDDDADVLRAARIALAEEFAPIALAGSTDGLERHLGAGDCELVLLDMNFVTGDRSGSSGLDGLARVRSSDPAVSVILMTAYGGVALAVEALKRGAMDFILKPWHNDKLLASARAAAAATRERRGSALDLDQLERETIKRALAQHRGNISLAAAALGLSRPALYRRMSKHGLS